MDVTCKEPLLQLVQFKLEKVRMPILYSHQVRFVLEEKSFLIIHLKQVRMFIRPVVVIPQLLYIGR